MIPAEWNKLSADERLVMLSLALQATAAHQIISMEHIQQLSGLEQATCADVWRSLAQKGFVKDTWDCHGPKALRPVGPIYTNPFVESGW